MKDNFNFYEEALTSPSCCKQKVEFKWIEAAEFYRRAVPIYDFDDDNLTRKRTMKLEKRSRKDRESD